MATEHLTATTGTDTGTPTPIPLAAPAVPPAFEVDRPTEELLVPVVPGDTDDRVEALAALLAESWDLPIVLLHVTPSVASTDVDLDQLEADLRLRYPALTFTAQHLADDDPARAIADRAGPRSLVLMATEHIDRWAVKRSVAEHVLDRIGAPVVLVGPNLTRKDLRGRGLDGGVVLGVDDHVGAEAGLTAANALARALGHRLWLVHVEPATSFEGGEADEQPGAYLQGLAERSDLTISTRWEVVRGEDPVNQIEALAARKDAAFVVACSLGRENPNRQTMASVAAGLAGVAARPVLVVKAGPSTT